MTAQQGPPAPEDRGVGVHVTVLHWRYLMLEQLRTPMGFLSAAAFPALSLLFFVVPFDYGGDPVAATVAVAGLAVFAVTNSFLFTFGVGVADDREKPWDPYLRSLPASAAPRIAGRLLCGASYGLIAAVPVVVVGALFTAATTSPARLLLGLIALPVVGVPFLLGGLAIGYSLPVKVALPVTQLVFFPIAFAGGLLLPPQLFPPWLQVLSLAAPSRGARELVVWAVADVAPDGRALLILVGWTVLTGLLAVRAYTVTRDADSADRGRSWSASAPARPAETASRGRAVRPEPRNLSIS